MGKYDYLTPPVAPHMTTGVRTRASKAVTTGSMTTGSISAGAIGIQALEPEWNATTGAPNSTHDGVGTQAIVPHPATHEAIANAQRHPAAVAGRTQQRAAISNVQSALAAHGFDPGSTNGELDHSTRRALKGFQSANNLPQTGTIDSTTHAMVTDVPRRAGSSVTPATGAIQHGAPKGSPVVRVGRGMAPMSPSAVPLAGTVAHPSLQALRSAMAPPKASPSPVSFRNSAGGHRAPSLPPMLGGQTRSSWSGAGDQTAGKVPSTSGSMQSAGPTGGPPQGAGAVAGGTQSVVSFPGMGSGSGGAGAGDTAGRSGGFRPGGSAGRKAQGGQAPAQTSGRTHMASNKGGTKGWRSTGWRICLVLTATIVGAGTANISVNPQMDFRGENLVIDGTTVGPSSTLTIPAIGTIPQIAGGTSSTAVPGTLFSPNQAGALDFKMSIANQGNAVQFVANNTNSTVTLSFAALLFGAEVEMDQSGGMTTGVAPAGSYQGG